MEKDFWLDAWKENEIGFHNLTINPLLENYFKDINLKPNSNILVPLCGKSLDMLWFEEKGHNVFGIELSSLAIEAFLSENQRQYEIVKDEEQMKVYKSGNITLFCGDFFSVTKEDLPEEIHLVYDRAAMIALPQEIRAKYTHKINEFAPASILLITLEYDDSKIGGPPFSVIQPEVSAYYKAQYDINLAHEAQEEIKKPSFREAGLTHCIQRLSLLERK